VRQCGHCLLSLDSICRTSRRLWRSVLLSVIEFVHFAIGLRIDYGQERVWVPTVCLKKSGCSRKGDYMGRAGNRLVLVVLAAALAAGLGTSVLVRPESALTASDECYGSCRTVTDLFLSSIFVIYGREQDEHFEVMVTADHRHSGLPPGEVEVESGGKVLCTIHLHNGRGRCSLRPRELKPGLHDIVARYIARNGFESSRSREVTLIVLRHPFFEGPGGNGLGGHHIPGDPIFTAP
jgi:hypothetical protein